MKKILLSLIMITLTGCSIGNSSEPDKKPDLPTQAIQEEAEKHCTWLFHMTKFIMANRQEEIPLAQVLESLSEISPQYVELIEALMYEAYKYPIGGTPENRMMYIKKFANDTYSACLDNEAEKYEAIKPKI